MLRVKVISYYRYSVLLCCINVSHHVVSSRLGLFCCLLSLLCCLHSLTALYSVTIFRLSINYVFDELILIVPKCLVFTSLCSTVSPFIVYQAPVVTETSCVSVILKL
jgi:hypothetical protein